MVASWIAAERSELLLGEKFRDRRADLAVLLDQHPVVADAADRIAARARPLRRMADRHARLVGDEITGDAPQAGGAQGLGPQA